MKTPMWHRYARFLGADPASDVKDELRFHLDARIDDLIAQGLKPEDAQCEALRQFGNVEAVQKTGERLGNEIERTRQRRDWWSGCAQDFRFALRTLRRDRAFAIVTVLILSLGIAANTAVFSVVNAVLLRPLPFPDAHRLAWLASGKTLPGDVVKAAGLGAVTYSVSAFEEFAKNNQAFAAVTSYNPFFGNSEYTMTGQGQPQPAAGLMVAGNFFQTLGVQPALGRLFVNEECVKGGRKAVLLSDAFWLREFAANPAILGKSITLNKVSVTVVGVLPPRFDFGSVFAPGLRIDVFVPAVMDDMRNWGNTLALVGRLKPGVPVSRAQAEADLLFPQLRLAHKDWELDYASTIIPLGDFVSGKLRRSLLVLWCAVGLILLIVCVNLSSLLLARAVSRSKEFALRTALGAGRMRLVRQLATESLVLAVSGAALGLTVAYLITAWLANQGSIALPLLSSVTVDGAALLWTLAITGAITVVLGLVPALRLADGDIPEALKDGGRSMSAGRRHETLRASLVVSEVALACVLLVGAGLLLRSFLKVLDIDPGFEASRAAAIRVDYDDGGKAERRGPVLQEMLRRISALPGVEAAGVADMLPLGRNRAWGFTIKGKSYPKGGIGADIALVRIVTPGYLAAMGMRLREGRDFTWRDGTRDPQVMILNQAAVREFWPAGENPLGRLVNRDGDTKVVGIISDVRGNSLEAAAEPEMYLPVTQADPEGAELVIRSKLPPSALASDVMKTLRSMNPAQPASELRPLQQIVDQAVSPRRFFVLLVCSFATLGLILASLGIYGVISYSVNRQTQEIGIRMALGAAASQVQRGVVAGALRLAFTGIALGVVASFVAAKWIASLLFATEPTDPYTFGAIVALLSVVAAVAGYVPARRASRIDPMVALRSE